MLERGHIQRNSNGDPVRAIGCCVDVSEIKRLTDLLAETQSSAEMGGWEYSYSTRELTWTEEMFRIYETTPAEFVVSWDSMLAQCTPESPERYYEAVARAESRRRATRHRTRNHHAQRAANLGTDDRPSRDARRQAVSCIRLPAEYSGAEALADRARNQHRVAETVDEHGEHARLALGQGAGTCSNSPIWMARKASARDLSRIEGACCGAVHPEDRVAATRAIEHAFSHQDRGTRGISAPGERR